MAKQTGDDKYIGTIEGLVCYKMYGAYYVRSKSSLTGKRFWKDGAFDGSRKSCSLLAKASALASNYYKTYPEEKRRKGLFNEMTGRVKLWLKEGKTEDETVSLLQQHYPVNPEQKTEEKRPLKKAKKAAVKKKRKLFIVPIEKEILLNDRKRTAKRLYGLGPPGVLSVNLVPQHSYHRISVFTRCLCT